MATYAGWACFPASRATALERGGGTMMLGHSLLVTAQAIQGLMMALHIPLGPGFRTLVAESE